ncbi:carbon-nitrogen hydrolase, partial [Pseudomonas aeruginosa]|nr:carbon-nitrogen hydrolase [Pseudomonas aeruginosa]
LGQHHDGHILGLWKALAGELDLVIVGSFFERLDPQRVANSDALVYADGVHAIYRHAYLWNEGSGIFEAGEQPPPVVATRFGRIAVLVCYALEFHELVRLHALSYTTLLCAQLTSPAATRHARERKT